MIARHAFDYDALLRDVAESVPVILPTTAVQWCGDTVVARRGIASVRFERCAPGEARVVFARHDIVDLDARVPIVPSHADDVIADVVGYLIGASVGSLSLYPHHGTKPVLPTRARSRRRTTTWDRERMTARARGAEPPALAVVRA